MKKIEWKNASIALPEKSGRYLIRAFGIYRDLTKVWIGSSGWDGKYWFPDLPGAALGRILVSHWAEIPEMEEEDD